MLRAIDSIGPQDPRITMVLSAQLQRTAGTVDTSNNGHNLIIADGLCPKIAELLPGALHELVALGAALQRASALPALLEPALQTPWLNTLATALQAPPECAALLQAALLPEPSAMVRDGNVINHGFDAELDELRGIQNNGDTFLLALEVRERVRGVTLKPEAFAEYLTSPNVAEGGGFKRMEVLGGVQGEEGKEFSRPMLAFFK